MIGLIFFVVILGALAALAAAVDRWGVDSRTMTTDGRPMSLFAR
jgi:hypothetical protein